MKQEEHADTDSDSDQADLPAIEGWRMSFFSTLAFYTPQLAAIPFQ